jgi:FecR protein
VVKPVLLAVFVLSAPALVAAASPAGALNSFEGKVREVGRTFRTEQGMAEILLVPGSFLRLGERSRLTLEAIGTPDVRVRLENGEALLEVIALPVPIVMKQDGVSAVIRTPGLYEFDQKHSVVSVYSGEARFSKGGHQIIAIQGISVAVRSLRKYAISPIPGDPLLSWSRIRSEQLSDESAASALAYPGGAGGHAANWYRVPWSGSYTFLSASGTVTGPFGWPYYSPGYTPNAIPTHPSGDSYLYGPPVPANPITAPQQPVSPGPGPSPYTVPLTAPGVPQFPNNRQ